MLLAYLVWDPKPGMFNFDIPILQRPILWYGFLFAFGFFVGFLVLTYLLRRYFLLKPEFCKEDVSSWPGLVHGLYASRGPVAKKIFSKLSASNQQWCSEWKVGQHIDEEDKKALLSAINAVLVDPRIKFDTPLTSLSRRLFSFAARRWSEEASLKALKRLQIEQELKSGIHTIKAKTAKKAEQLTFYVLIGAIVGARLGDVLFYQSWLELARNPLSIFAVWQGGLASHGGAAGILIALGVFTWRRKIPFWSAVDFTVIPTAIAAVFIRIGNFFNQEILGTPTHLPWGIIFLHPADGGPIVPRHPAQLYEALWYLCVFGILMWYWHRHLPFKPVGKVTGLFLLLVFGFRFFIEFIKMEQSAHLSPAALLTMGQILSVPFVILGCYLLFRKRY